MNKQSYGMIHVEVSENKDKKKQGIEQHSEKWCDVINPLNLVKYDTKFRTYLTI